jgi:hypothetical protein
MVTAVAVVVSLLAAAGDAAAQQHKMTRLGNPGTRITAPISNTAGLQKTFTVPRNQAALSRVLDKAGLTSLTAQVLAAITEGRVTETSVAPGTTIQWMALRRAGRPDIVSDAVWAGTAPFEGFAFSIDDGLKRYNFVVPKACGNLALVSVTEVPLPECVHVASSRSCESKQVTFTASGTAIATRQATKVSVYRDGRKVGEMLPEGFALALPVDAGRYTFMATDTHGREYGTCERDIMVEACAVAPVAPPPPPPPVPTSCGALLTATRVKGGLNMVIDGSASAAGASPATRAHIKLVGPDGNELTFTHGGTQMSEAELAPPFSATFFVAKARPGTYTLRAKTSAADPRAEARSCESTVYVPENDTVDWFIDGNGGKQRRQYDLNAIAPSHRHDHARLLRPVDRPQGGSAVLAQGRARQHRAGDRCGVHVRRSRPLRRQRQRLQQRLAVHRGHRQRARHAAWRVRRRRPRLVGPLRWRARHGRVHRELRPADEGVGQGRPLLRRRRPRLLRCARWRLEQLPGLGRTAVHLPLSALTCGGGVA